MEYGVTSEGFVKKPLDVILREREDALITIYGAELIQTPQSPKGQENALTADLIADLWELAENIYLSNDPDQAEGIGLDSLGSLRNARRGVDSDPEFRRVITNEDQARIDIQDISRSISGIDGVTYSRVFINDRGQFTSDGLSDGEIAVAVIGGDDQEIADALRLTIAAGLDTFGNARVESFIDGFCRSTNIIRPIESAPNLTLNVRRFTDSTNCPPPSLQDIKGAFIESWNNSVVNGDDVDAFNIRRSLERIFSTVELVSFFAESENIPASLNSPFVVSFIERIIFTDEDVTINEVS